MEAAIILIAIFCTGAGAGYGYNLGFTKGLIIGKNEAIKNIEDYTKGKESTIAKNISESYNKS